LRVPLNDLAPEPTRAGRKLNFWPLLALAAAAVVVIPADLPIRFVATVAVIYAFAILSLVLLTGYVGQVSLCQATFLGMAAFTTGFLVDGPLHFNYFVAAAFGVMASFCLGVLIGIPALRVRGILLAIVTAAVALVFDYYFFQDPAFAWFTGGSGGWQIDHANLGALTVGMGGHPMFGRTDIQELPVYWLLLVLFGGCAWFVHNLRHSGAGRRLLAIRDSEVAAATMGVDVVRYKLLGFGIAAAIAGVGGAMFPLVLQSVSNGPFAFAFSLQFAAFGVLIGIRHIPAAALGGAFMSVLPELLKRIELFGQPVRYDYFAFALGLVLVIQLIVAPTGIWDDVAHRMRHRPARVKVATA